jgi:putative ABC transport system substrate-binding protein
MRSTRARIALIACLALAAAPSVAEAQPAGTVHRVGMLETRSAALNAANVDAFREGMRALGYVEGQNLVIEYRSSDGRDERFAALAADLVRLNVHLIVTRGTPAALAAKRATATIPVVMAGAGDPVSSGIVAQLSRPGGNVTGLSSLIPDLNAKRVELLRELLPKLTRIAVMLNMGNPVIPAQWKAIEATARSINVEPQLLDVRRPEDVRPAVAAAVKRRADALFVGVDGVTQGNLRLIAELVAQHRLPSIYGAREYVAFGGLMTYGVSDLYMYGRAASFVDRILKGAKPAELPVEQPARFELSINLQAARTLGLTIPQSLLLRADHLVE